MFDSLPLLFSNLFLWTLSHSCGFNHQLYYHPGLPSQTPTVHFLPLTVHSYLDMGVRCSKSGAKLTFLPPLVCSASSFTPHLSSPIPPGFSTSTLFLITLFYIGVSCWTLAFSDAFEAVLNGADIKSELDKAAQKIDEDISDNGGYPPFGK